MLSLYSIRITPPKSHVIMVNIRINISTLSFQLERNGFLNSLFRYKAYNFPVSVLNLFEKKILNGKNIYIRWNVRKDQYGLTHTMVSSPFKILFVCLS